MDQQAAVAADVLPAFFDLSQHLIGSSSELGVGLDGAFEWWPAWWHRH
jgi:hypothetical protein